MSTYVKHTFFLQKNHKHVINIILSAMNGCYIHSTIVFHIEMNTFFCQNCEQLSKRRLISKYPLEISSAPTRH